MYRWSLCIVRICMDGTSVLLVLFELLNGVVCRAKARSYSCDLPALLCEKVLSAAYPYSFSGAQSITATVLNNLNQYVSRHFIFQLWTNAYVKTRNRKIRT